MGVKNTSHYAKLSSISVNAFNQNDAIFTQSCILSGTFPQSVVSSARTGPSAGIGIFGVRLMLARYLLRFHLTVCWVGQILLWTEFKGVPEHAFRSFTGARPHSVGVCRSRRLLWQKSQPLLLHPLQPLRGNPLRHSVSAVRHMGSCQANGLRS
jgi:hypothetical protein